MTDWADYLAGRIDPKRNPFVIQGEVVPQSVLDEVRGRRPL